MVTIKYGVVKSLVTSDIKLERKAVYALLDHQLAFFKKDYFWAASYQMSLWDGKQHFFYPKTGKLYTGFISRTLKILKAEGAEYDLVGYPMPKEDVDLDQLNLLNEDGSIVQPYEHQLLAINNSIKFSRGVVKVATNGGKTLIAAGIIKALGMPPSVYYVPRTTLVNQIAKQLEARLQVDVGRVGAGYNNPRPEGITVAMTHSTAANVTKSKVVPYVHNAKVMIGDECHLSSDGRYQKSIEACPADIRILMSGTPYKGDQVARGFVQAYSGPLLADVSNDELVEKGISAKPNILYLEPKIDLISRARYRMQEWNWALEECVERNWLAALVGKAFVEAGIQTIIMLRHVEHGKRILEHYPEATFTHGGASNRKATENRLRKGEVFCCIATAIFDTGLDVPNIGAIVYAGGGPDEIRVAQTLGRLLRQNVSKDKQPWFIDFWDTYHDVLIRHSRARKRYFAKHKTFTLTENLSLLPPRVYTSLVGGIAGVGKGL